jgi:hypothetical protein
LRSAERLAATDSAIAKEILAAVFVLPEGEGKKA